MIPLLFPQTCHTSYLQDGFQSCSAHYLRLKQEEGGEAVQAAYLPSYRKSERFSSSYQHTSIHLTGRNPVTGSNLGARGAEKTLFTLSHSHFEGGKESFGLVNEWWYLPYRVTGKRQAGELILRNNPPGGLNHPKVGFSFHTLAKNFNQHLINSFLITTS